jgi:hypothetical protein
MTGQAQYGRKCNLVLSNAAGKGLDLSEQRIKFAIKKTDGQTPNTAIIQVYNLSKNTMNEIESEFNSVLLQGGYESNYGVIFSGNAIRIGRGKDTNNTDTYLEIQAADGDAAYNFAVVNATISAGATQRDQIETAAKVMRSKGIESGYIETDETTALPRGKVLYGMARDYLRQSAQSSAASWTIQNGVLQIVPLTGVLPNEAIVLNSKTGLIGQATQTNTGIKFRSLLNPFLLVGGAVQINEDDISEGQLETPADDPKTNKKKDSKDKTLATIETDGFYRVITLTYTGDTRGNDWYCEGECLDIDTTVESKKSVQAN